MKEGDRKEDVQKEEARQIERKISFTLSTFSLFAWEKEREKASRILRQTFPKVTGVYKPNCMM